MTTPAHDHEYTAEFVTGLEWIWGPGFLSPGGAHEVAALLDGVDLGRCRVLDVGCGIGAIDILLVKDHGAATVVGIDVEQPLIARAQTAVLEAGVDGSASFQLVAPGPLPFADASFDIVFSKDSIIHISDKDALYKEVLRVLVAGGVFVGSDWLRGGDGAYSLAMQTWLDVVGLSFDMKNLQQTQRALEQAGFEQVRMRDRNTWYQSEIKHELAALSGVNYERLVQQVGGENAARRRRSSTLKQAAVMQGDLRPTHFRGYKPD